MFAAAALEGVEFRNVSVELNKKLRGKMEARNAAGTHRRRHPPKTGGHFLLELQHRM
jgi:hypothetical protein